MWKRLIVARVWRTFGTHASYFNFSSHLNFSGALKVSLLACLLAGGLQGCGGSPSDVRVKEEQKPQAGAQATPSATPAAEAQVYEDEAMLKGSRAVVGGTVENVSGTNLEELSVEIELKRRKDGAQETRSVQVEPQNLAPGERGRYALTVTRDWNSARLVRLKSGTRGGGATIAYSTARGALRPPEKPPEPKTKVVVVPRPRPKGEEFINTPETADRVP
ncbi:MAG TPA: hypothetical protein VNA19_01665 [Pyrinomonadaceae bacterium]|jgi:hypothetical protein|nr:hypothetical protein [Pyrinomonadaceae bacterium]